MHRRNRLTTLLQTTAIPVAKSDISDRFLAPAMDG